ncbi:MAG: respiratory nitrate reductase subunit gamma [Azospirillaceae bacterium]
MPTYLHEAFFGWYPYLCLAVFLIGSFLRFEREQYTWRSGSSQLLRKRQLMWGSILFHVGILFLFFGHLVGLLTPHWVYESFIGAGQKQVFAIVSGGLAGLVCFVGLTMLLHRRLFDARVRVTTTFADMAILVILWVQLVLGLLTLPFSLQHTDGAVMLRLAEWSQRIVTGRQDAADLLLGIAWPYQVHIILGLTIFLIFPFSRLVHIWSAPVWFLGRRGYQIVRTRDTGRRAAPARPGRIG